MHLSEITGPTSTNQPTKRFGELFHARNCPNAWEHEQCLLGSPPWTHVEWRASSKERKGKGSWPTVSKVFKASKWLMIVLWDKGHTLTRTVLFSWKGLFNKFPKAIQRSSFVLRSFQEWLESGRGAEWMFVLVSPRSFGWCHGGELRWCLMMFANESPDQKWNENRWALGSYWLEVPGPLKKLELGWQSQRPLLPSPWWHREPDPEGERTCMDMHVTETIKRHYPWVHQT